VLGCFLTNGTVRVIEVIVRWMELLGGVHPPRRRTPVAYIAWGIWWAVLFLAVFATIGSATRFIYVDF
jgi:hypothetical protein